MIKKTPNKNELELRKWCIEMAIKWQWSAPFHSAAMQGGFQSKEAAEPNTLDRAEKIYNWVKKG